MQAAFFALNNPNIKTKDGFSGKNIEDTIKNIGILSKEGMLKTNKTILKIMSCKT